MRKLYEMEDTWVELTSKDEFVEYNRIRARACFKRYECDFWETRVYKDSNPCLRILSHDCHGWDLGEYCRSIGRKILTLKQLKERLGMWKEGDILKNINNDYRCKVLSTNGNEVQYVTRDNCVMSQKQLVSS